MVTRQSELIRLLSELARELPDPLWIVLVDEDGLMLASAPGSSAAEGESVAAMTVAQVMLGERVVRELDAGHLRYVNIAGSRTQQLAIVLRKDRLLSVGLKPDVAPQDTFQPLSRRVPELLEILNRSFGAG